MAPFLRPYEPGDAAALRVVCLRTAAAGRDATGLVSDRRLPGDVYAVPYGELVPETSLVLEQHDDVLGYVVAALDTATFEERCEREWWPHLRERHPPGSGTRPLDATFIDMIHEPPLADRRLLERYPSHLHINLLPEAQGGGWGRTMMDAITGVLERLGSGGIHLIVDADNQPALQFYERIGFQRWRTSPDEVVYVR